MAEFRYPQVQTDAARLPLAVGYAAAVVIGDGPPFAAEAARVMDVGAALVWSKRAGREHPLFFMPVEVLAHATAATAGRSLNTVHTQPH